MKGIVFTEFLEMVEGSFGLEVLDRMVESCDLSTGGAYTTVSTYDHRELLQMVGQLSAISGIAVPDLVKSFGRYLFGRFAKGFPQFFGQATNTFSFLSKIESYIHIEVRKLYPDAELPKIDCRQLDANRMEMVYRSNRPFGDFAEGLIVGCMEHFGEDIDIRREELPCDKGVAIRFSLTCLAGVPR